MLALTCALVAAALGGFLFSSTRRIGLLSLAALVLLHPALLVLFIVVVAAVLYFIYLH